MTDTALPRAEARPLPLFWPALLAATLAAALYGPVPVPAWLTPDIAGALSRATAWLVEEADLGLFTFREATRGIAWAIEQPYALVRILLVDGITEGRGARAVTHFPPLSWAAVILIVAAIGWHLRGWGLALFAAGCFAYLAVFGRWESAMVTLSSILIAVPLGVGLGLALGILAHAVPAFERALRPVLDLMQTVPVFAYLVPILFLFGFGPVAALVATVIYAMPPIVRVTILALRGVPAETVEFAAMAGCSRPQTLFGVMLPVALPALMVGVNQVIMLSLNMVIIASMIGAGGLGFDVLTALRRLDIGGGIEAGLAITALALALDRLGQAWAAPRPRPVATGGWLHRHRLAVGVVVAAALLTWAGMHWPELMRYPRDWTISTRGFWSDLVRGLNIAYFDTFEAVKGWMLGFVMLPVKRFLLSLPWPFVVLALGLAGGRIGGWRLAGLAAGLALFVVATGLWEAAMTTVYLCGVAVAIACLIGWPLGLLAASDETAGRIVGAVMDTLQTLPSFVYLIPVVMLFRVGDFAALVAVVLYALAPAVRYTAHGLRGVPAELVEAGTVSGCTRGQMLRHIRLPMAAPAILLGVNQTVMLALSMLVITALVGTRDLGQEVYIALTRADVGAGLVAGLAVAAIAIIADRLITGAADRLGRGPAGEAR
ncbi:MAG: ABC transporter permease [Gemmobacter sp.]